MELVFHKENGLYITEFEVTSDFNVHLERSKGGKVSFYQKTTDGNYDHIEKLSKNIDKVFDYDFQALVYPKIIKITSECEFDVASLTTDGEVTEIKSQSKEVEITSNGVTEIAPDAGFGYLSGVKVNVNVPQSGGESGGGNIEYLDMSNARNLLDSVGSLSIECKGISDDISLVAPTASVQPMVEAVGIKITQIKIDWDSTVIQNIGGQIIKTTALESVLNRVSQDELDNIPRITKEQFYTI